MPRGGARPGAGRKPKPREAAPAIVVGMDGLPRRDMSGPRQVEAPELLVPPADLSAEQQAFWRLWAPAAVRQETLIPETVIGFRELAEQWVMKQQIAAFIERNGGAANPVMDSLLRQYLKLAQRVDASIARFKLTAFGKPAAADAGKKRPATVQANPWAQVATT